MGYKIYSDAKGKLVYTERLLELKIAELPGTLVEINSLLESSSISRVLVDGTALNHPCERVDVYYYMSDFLSRLKPGTRIACLVSDQQPDEMLRFKQTLADNMGLVFRNFRQEEEARNWLEED